MVDPATYGAGNNERAKIKAWVKSKLEGASADVGLAPNEPILKDDTLYKELKKHKCFYSVMYTGYPLEDAWRIVRIDYDKVSFAENGKTFFWTWGATDFNKYSRKNYGKEWAYDKQVLLDYWGL